MSLINYCFFRCFELFNTLCIFIMVNFKKKSQTLILLILVIIFSINTNFLNNMYEIIFNKFDNRITKKYDYCIGESIGYLLHIKKKYQINDNPKIINYAHTPNVNWSIINTKEINQNSSNLIFLNYPGKNYIKNLKKINDNLYELNDAYFLTDKFSKIQNIRILNTLDENKTFSLKLNIYTLDKFRNKTNIRTLDIKNIFDTSRKVNLDMNLKDLNLDEKKLYFEIENNDIINFNNLQMNIELINNYILENFQIINKTNNCYYVKKI